MQLMPQVPSFEKIFVTGGTGFIGRHLLQALVDQGHSPTAIVRRIEHVEELPEVLRKGVRWIELDLLDEASVERIIEAERPTIVFHLAGTRRVGNEADGTASLCHELNVEATRHVIAVSNQAGAERIVIVGSAEEFGSQPGPFNESTPLKPDSIYGKSKAEATRLALAMHEKENCPVVIVRLFTVYGPNQPRGMFVSDAIEAAVYSDSFSMSEGTQKRDLVFVEDAVRGIIAAGSTPGIEGMAFNFGSGTPVRLRDVAEMIWRISESQASLLIGDRVRAADDMQVTWADTSLARQYLDWEPVVDLEKGLRMTIDWAQERESQDETKFVTR